MVNVSTSLVVREKGRPNCCHRCGGFMVPETVFEVGSIDWHCVSCGDRIDPVILAHRQRRGLKDPAREEAGRFVGKGKARLHWAGSGESCNATVSAGR